MIKLLSQLDTVERDTPFARSDDGKISVLRQWTFSIFGFI